MKLRSFLYGLIFVGATSCVLRTSGLMSTGPDPAVPAATPVGEPGVAPPAGPGTAVAPPATPVGVRGVVITSARADGEVLLSGGVGFDAGGNLIVSMPAVRHPETGLVVGTGGAALTMSAQVAGGAMLACGIGNVSSSAKAPVDIVFINDTTGSMSGTVNGIADSISAFSNDLLAAGVDARFSMYTYGDAFATKRPGDPFYTGRGDFAPPHFDETSRPYVGLSDLYTFQNFLKEMKASRVLGVGGGDDPENTLGTLAYANRTVGWRYGAARTFVVTGDNPAHQPGDGTSGSWGMFAPPPAESIISQLAGNAVVHVIGKSVDKPGYYNIKNLAARTGGVFLTLPDNGRVNLTSLGMTRVVTNGFRGICTAVGMGSVRLTITATIMGARVYTGRLTFELQVT